MSAHTALNNDYPVHDADRTAVAKVYANDDANARLIAAAPEMLECLRDMTCKLCDTPVPHPWCDRARALLAKIEMP